MLSSRGLCVGLVLPRACVRACMCVRADKSNLLCSLLVIKLVYVCILHGRRIISS